MPNSQNGWPVVGRNEIVDKAVLGVEFPNGWLKGDVDVIFTELVKDLNNIEPIDKGGCWGWGVKIIQGGSSYSNHSSGTAIDYNAPAHPMGKRNTYSEVKRSAIRKLLKEKYENVIRWGGDYTGRPDDMHFEVNANAAAIRRVADKISDRPKPPKTFRISVDIPLYKEGDRDSKYIGYYTITRMQRIVKTDADGIWGKKTSEAIAAFVKMPVNECRALNEELARKVFGLRG